VKDLYPGCRVSRLMDRRLALRSWIGHTGVVELAAPAQIEGDCDRDPSGRGKRTSERERSGAM
jgi:hypothetical protein